MLDFSQPVALLLMNVLHFISDAEDPRGIVARLRDALPSGSYLVLGHGTQDGTPVAAQALKTVYNRSVATQAHMRSRSEIMRLFDGFDLVDPGLVYVPQWRPDPAESTPAQQLNLWCLVGVGRKP
ncbi:MAG TPA: SAM-dependent methyltransferase, partial [Streptosporangiaceae bacterium]|jgi:hypothetical protein